MNTHNHILSYNDCLLDADDLDLLEPGQWINDKIIDFVYEWVFFCYQWHLSHPIGETLKLQIVSFWWTLIEQFPLLVWHVLHHSETAG